MYIVVFEGIGGPQSNTLGIRTFTEFSNKQDFDDFRKTSDSQDKVIAEGITLEEASEKIEEVGFKPYFDQAYTEANYGETFDWNIYNMHLENIKMLMTYRSLHSKTKPVAYIESYVHDQGGGNSWCSNCQTAIKLSDIPKHCPNCGRKLIFGKASLNQGGSDF
jgi:hypothetical protein